MSDRDDVLAALRDLTHIADEVRRSSTPMRLFDALQLEVERARAVLARAEAVDGVCISPRSPLCTVGAAGEAGAPEPIHKHQHDIELQWVCEMCGERWAGTVPAVSRGPTSTGPWYAVFNELPGLWGVRRPDRAIESGQAVGPLENAVEAIAVRDALNSVAASSAGKEP